MKHQPPGQRMRVRFGIVGSVVLALTMSACSDGSDAGGTTTSTVTESTTVDALSTRQGVLLNKYATALNAGDVAESMKAFAGDPVVKKHPFALNDYMDRSSELRDVDEGVAAIQGSGSGLEFVDVAVSDGTSVVAPDITFGWRFFYGADGSESGGEAGCIGGRDAKAFISNGQITEIDWGFEDPTKCED